MSSDNLESGIQNESSKMAENATENHDNFFVIDQVGDVDQGSAQQTSNSELCPPPPSEVDGLFCLDTKPDSTPVSKEKNLGPRYRREFDQALTSGNETDQGVESKNVPKQDGRCFNCLGDHTLINCPLPKNQQAISKNRKAFLNNQVKVNHNRYHVEKSNKFSHLKPGKISEALRDALGLRSREIPIHIYQMRIHGYPPGWIEEMKEDSSEINIIDNAASAQSSPSSFQKVTYDTSKIIEYPGFNVPLPPYFRDDWQYLNFPPMLPVHSKEYFAQCLMYNNHAMYNQATPPAPPLPPPPPPPPAVSSNQDNSDMEESSCDSIEQLETQRLALLAELSESEKKPVEIPFQCEGNSKDEDAQSNSPQLDSDWKSLKTPTHGRCKHREMGTPASFRFSPYSTLPDREKFSSNMGDMIPYENLPNSTGTFEKMKGLLVKVRNLFKKKT